MQKEMSGDNPGILMGKEGRKEAMKKEGRREKGRKERRKEGREREKEGMGGRRELEYLEVATRILLSEAGPRETLRQETKL